MVQRLRPATLESAIEVRFPSRALKKNMNPKKLFFKARMPGCSSPGAL